MSDIVEQFQRLRRDDPERALLHVPSHGHSLTARDVWTLSQLQYSALKALGVGPDSLVIVATGNRPETLTLWLACRRLGAALMPVDHGTPATEIAALAKRFGATLAIAHASKSWAGVLGTPEYFCKDLLGVWCAGVEPKPEWYRGAAVLKITSGSSGPVKATFTTESQLLRDTTHICAAMQITPSATQIAAIPMSHSYGIGNLLMPLLLFGTPMVLRDSFVPQLLPGDAIRYEARVFPGVPFMFDQLATVLGPGCWPPTLHRLISAGARLETATIQAFKRLFGLKIHSFYGTSETGGISFDDSPDVDGEPTVGRVLPGVSVTLKPEHDVTDGGRVHVAGEAVASGYAGDAASDGAFTDDGFLTGDIGSFDARGHLVLKGRASSFINVAGRKVQPEEVEQVLLTMPGIEDVRVIGIPDPQRGEQVIACIVSRAQWCTAYRVREFCSTRLAGHKIPRSIVRLEKIPLTDRGKTDRHALRTIVQIALAQLPASGVL